MNGIDNITKRIADEAENEARKIIAAAEADVAAMRREYDKKATEVREKILTRAEKDADEASFRIESSASANARRTTLAKKQELISDAFVNAEKKLSSLSGDELADVLSALALRAAAGESGELILSEKDVSLKEKILSKCTKNKGITISDSTHSFGGGFIFKRGNTETNCTFERLVAELRDELQLEVAEILFS